MPHPKKIIPASSLLEIFRTAFKRQSTRRKVFSSLAKIHELLHFMGQKTRNTQNYNMDTCLILLSVNKYTVKLGIKDHQRAEQIMVFLDRGLLKQVKSFL